jgi:site-specific DNA-methyltransferase (adenine-specific)
VSMVEIIGNATLHMGDCLEVLPSLQAVDAVVSDPPYGISLGKMSSTYTSRWNYSKGAGLKSMVKRERQKDDRYGYLIHGDDVPFDPAPWLAFPKIILWGGVHFAKRLPETRSWLVWDKRENGTSDNQADCEIAWSNLPGPARLKHHLWRGLARRGEENPSREPRSHPTQKPIDLMSWCIDLCKLKPDSMIVDGYMGTGSTGIAAVRAGHRFVGVEIEPSYFAIACKRIEQAQKQARLFA